MDSQWGKREPWAQAESRGKTILGRDSFGKAGFRTPEGHCGDVLWAFGRDTSAVVGDPGTSQHREKL